MKMSDPYGVFDAPLDWPVDGQGKAVMDWDAFHELVFAREAKYASGDGPLKSELTTYTGAKALAEQKKG